jgi:hypothetical protein
MKRVLGSWISRKRQGFGLVAFGHEFAVQGTEQTISIKIKGRHTRWAALAVSARQVGTPQRGQAAEAFVTTLGDSPHGMCRR